MTQFIMDQPTEGENAMPTKSEYDRRKGRSLCVECGKNAAMDNRVRCEPCLLKHRKRDNKRNAKMRKPQVKRSYDRDTYEWRKAHNLCARCGNETPVKGKVFCWRCIMAKRDSRAVEYVARIDRGLCSSCGKPLDREGAICEACRVRRKENNALRRARIKEAGLCPVCGKRPMFEGKSCAICREKKREREQIRLWNRAHERSEAYAS